MIAEDHGDFKRSHSQSASIGCANLTEGFVPRNACNAVSIDRASSYGEASVIAGAAATTFFPAFFIIGNGLRCAPPATPEVFRALGAMRVDTLRYLALPAAAPSMFTALRLSAANSLLSAMAAEYLLGQVGLGNMLAEAQSSLLTARAWSASLVATILSVIAYTLIRRSFPDE